MKFVGSDHCIVLYLSISISPPQSPRYQTAHEVLRSHAQT